MNLTVGILANILLFAVVLLEFIFIVPIFEMMYLELGIRLPWLTQIIVSASNFLKVYFVIPIVIYGTVTFVIFNKNCHLMPSFKKILWVHVVVVVITLAAILVGLLMPLIGTIETIKSA